MRTVSSLESLHSAINRSTNQKNHFYKFVEVIRLHESQKADHFFAAIQNLPATRFQRNFKNTKRLADIKYYTDLLMNETYSTREFLLAMADDENGMSSPTMSCTLLQTFQNVSEKIRTIFDVNCKMRDQTNDHKF